MSVDRQIVRDPNTGASKHLEAEKKRTSSKRDRGVVTWEEGGKPRVCDVMRSKEGGISKRGEQLTAANIADRSKKDGDRERPLIWQVEVTG